MEGFAECQVSDAPEGAKASVAFSTICINVPKHLEYLLSAFRAEGGSLIKSKLQVEGDFEGTLKALERRTKANGLGDVDVFVNATGIRARDLVGDLDVFPIRGQTILVRGEARYATTMDENRYVIPRPGSATTILGGTRDKLDGPTSSWYEYCDLSLRTHVTDNEKEY